MINCNICGGTTTAIEVKEQMMGLQETFVYYKCNHCGHTHLHTIPEDMHRYYDTKEYYSFKKNAGLPGKVIKKSKTFLQKLFAGLGLEPGFLFSSALQPVLSIEKINKDSSILDYGCGAGQFVEELHSLGFKNVKGYDPYLPENQYYEGTLFLTNQLKGFTNTCWDLVTLNHVFEHLVNPPEVLHTLHKLLCPGGKLILRFPVIDSFAFEKYRENWVQFDAPRHINLFTRKSTRLAVEKAGDYKILGMYDDSYHFQFTGSDLYVKNLSLKSNNKNQLKRILSLKTWQYHFQAKKLNQQNKGDQVVVILERI